MLCQTFPLAVPHYKKVSFFGKSANNSSFLKMNSVVFFYKFVKIRQNLTECTLIWRRKRPIKTV